MPGQEVSLQSSEAMMSMSCTEVGTLRGEEWTGEGRAMLVWRWQGTWKLVGASCWMSMRGW